MGKKIRSGSTGYIRIIGGAWRGRKLPVLHYPGLRPTTDRMRETLFNWLMGKIEGVACLDCFSGSGALGLEALSRCARYVRLLEYNIRIARCLQENLLQLQTENGEVLQVDSPIYLQQVADRCFEVVFLDPPFGQFLLQTTIQQLEANHWLADSAWIYIEIARSHPTLRTPLCWNLYREKVTPRVMYQLYRRQLPLPFHSNQDKL